MIYKPFNYQREALKFALKNRACGLFARMGTGKTVVTLTLIDILMYEMANIRRVLLIAPLRVAMISWPDEIEKWHHTKHLTYQFLHGNKKDEDIRRIQDVDIVAVNFEGCRWLYNNKRYLARFDMIVVDESTWIKNPTAGRTKLIHEMSRFIPRRLILTGSPSPNSLMDVWSQIFVLDRGARLGHNITEYRGRYFFPDSQRRSYFLRSGAKREIVDAIADTVMVVEDKDIKAKYRIKENVINIELGTKLMKQYKELETDFCTTLDSGYDIEVLNQQAKTQKLRQFVSGFVYENDYRVVDIHQERLKTSAELIESLNRNVLVAIQFREEVNQIRAYFKNRPSFYNKRKNKWLKRIEFINSESNKAADFRNIKDWQAGKIDILLAHPASIGHGLNLQSGGCDIIWYSQTWSLEEWEQFIARLARTGQKSAIVMVHILIAKLTIDVPINQAISRKNSTQASVLNRLKQWREENAR